jgi:hypothetical protein
MRPSKGTNVSGWMSLRLPQEAGEILGISPSTVKREWRTTKACFTLKSCARSDMTPERWRIVKEVFEAALQQPEAQRSTYLSQACAGNQTLPKTFVRLTPFGP